jgi:PAS domain S-box-containing protein
MVEAGDGEEDEPELQLLARDELEQRVQRRSTELEEVLDTMADVLLKLDAEGRVRLANPAARDILGYEPSELLGRPIDHLLADDEETEMPTEGHLLDALVQEGRVTDVEVAMVTSDGETRRASRRRSSATRTAPSTASCSTPRTSANGRPPRTGPPSSTRCCATTWATSSRSPRATWR